MNQSQKGKMIVVYGVNGIGKTTQVELLVEFLKTRGKNASRLKYPVYDLEPEGTFIHKYLRDPEFREQNSKTTDELQKLYADNRSRYEPELIARLDAGEWIVAEDYTGTGIAWGLTWGTDIEYLEEINKHLLQPDATVLMHGHRFDTAIEQGHRNETESERITICKNFHILLAHKYGWQIINANQSIENVRKRMVACIKKML
jgi:dTMP kinase